MIRTMIQLTEEQLNALKELAQARNVSVASLVRESVEQYVITATQEAEREEKRQRALEFVRKIEAGEIQFRDIEGKTDLSIKHDDYFVEAAEE
jgi:hypothetical protein